MASILKYVAAAAIVSIAALVAAPAAAHSRHHRHVHHHHVHHVALFSYLHNYGPGSFAGAYAFYDGPQRTNCKQGAAAYRGQDGRGHPCL